MDVRSVIDLVKDSPQVQQAVDVIDAQLERAPIMPGDLDEIIKMLEAVVEDPRRYPEVRAAAIKDGIVREQDAPPEYDATFVLSVLVALYGYRDRLQAKGYARGGLKVAGRQLASQGRGGDTMLAHINPREAEMLRRMGGTGTVNPNTGLHEYKSGGILGAILPIALNFIAPGLGATIGSMMGASGAAAGMLGQAVIGGLSSAVTGGNPLQGAIMGGMGAGLGSAVGSSINNAMNLGLGTAAQNVIGGAVVGGIGGAASGQGFGKGALMGGLGAGVGQLAAGNNFGGATGAGVSSAGSTFANMLAAGYDPKTAALGSALSGAASGAMYKPTEPYNGTGLSVPKGTEAQAATLGTKNYLTGEQGVVPGQAPTLTGNAYSGVGELKAPQSALENLSLAASEKPSDSVLNSLTNKSNPNMLTAERLASANSGTGNLTLPNFGLKDAGNALVLASVLNKNQNDINQEVQKLTPEQQEVFNRPGITWDWEKMQRDAAAANLSLGDYMARNWPTITGYSTQGTDARQGAYVNKATGGALTNLARGSGSGRDDTINARLSDGEYVMDAETVSMLGDGSTKEGARRLDAMREQLRKHKGKTLARGKFSPNAKSPLEYLKGAA